MKNRARERDHTPTPPAPLRRLRPAPLLAAMLAPLLLAPLAMVSTDADAQVIRRCDGPDGTTIFTDKACAAFGATQSAQMDYQGNEYGEIHSDGAYADGREPGELRDPPETMGPDGVMSTGFAMRGCARTRGDLIAGVRAAIEMGDVNRLSNYYHWTGISQSHGAELLDRLDRIARNTLAGVHFDYPYEKPYRYATAEYEPPARAEPEPIPVQVAYTAGPSYLDRFAPRNDDVPVMSSGIVDASTPLEDALPSAAAVNATADTDSGQPVSGIVDASTPLDEARMLSMSSTVGTAYGYSRANPEPVALRVNNGGGTGTRFQLKQNAGCWFIQF